MKGLYAIKGYQKRNWVKLKCLYCLQNFRKAIPGTMLKGLNLNDLASLTRCNKGSLYVLTKRWYQWGLVQWYRIPGDVGVESYFTDTARGNAYLKGASKWYPLIQEVMEEVQTAWKRYQAIHKGDLATVKAIDASYQA